MATSIGIWPAVGLADVRVGLPARILQSLILIVPGRHLCWGIGSILLSQKEGAELRAYQPLSFP